MLLALLAAGLSVLTLGVQDQASAATAAEFRDSSADVSRTVPAYRSVDDPNRVVRVFSVKFWAREGERRYITSRVLASQPTDWRAVLRGKELDRDRISHRD